MAVRGRGKSETRNCREIKDYQGARGHESASLTALEFPVILTIGWVEGEAGLH